MNILWFIKPYHNQIIFKIFTCFVLDKYLGTTTILLVLNDECLLDLILKYFHILKILSMLNNILLTKSVLDRNYT